MMANVALRNWRFLYNMGLSGCKWFGGTIGNYMEVRKLALVGGQELTISPDGRDTDATMGESLPSIPTGPAISRAYPG